MKRIVTIASLLAFCGVAFAGTLKDSRDGKAYKTVEVGGQEWMAENLNFKTKSSVCYGKKEANCKSFGRLYTWDDATKVCPEGWRLPSSDDLENLLKAAGGTNSEEMPAIWEGASEKLMDKTLFATKFAGYGMAGKSFTDKGSTAEFWSATAVENAPIAYRLEVDPDAAGLTPMNKTNNLSVRCVKNP